VGSDHRNIVPNMYPELRELEIERSNIEIPDELTIRDYYELRQQLSTYTKDMRDVINHPNYCIRFMQPGRLVHVKYMDFDFGWGAVVKYSQRRPGKGQSQEDIIPQDTYLLDVVLPVAAGSASGSKSHQALPPGLRPPANGEKVVMEVVPVLLSCVQSLSRLRIFLPKDLKSAEERNGVKKALDEVKKRFPDGIALLDPIEDMQITDDSFKKLLRVC
jgi:ATP-dependent RNA helicase DOB1